MFEEENFNEEDLKEALEDNEREELLEVPKYLIEAIKAGESINLDFSKLPLSQAVKIREIILNNVIKKARNDLMTYVELMGPEIIPEGFLGGRHINLIASKLMEIEQSVVEAYKYSRLTKKQRALIKDESKKNKKAKKLQIFLAPGCMKSKLVSILFVTWFMGRHPSFPILQLGHSTKFCIDNFGRQVLEVLNSDKFKSIFPEDECRVKRSARSIQSFELEGGGKYYTTGAGSKIAGRRAALLLSDDVISEQEAYSQSLRTKINEWYIPGARSRKLPYGAEVIVNTRWSLEDLSGYIEKKDKNDPWEIIRIPALLDREGAKLLGLPEGESCWPELWPTEHFQELKSIMAPSKFNSMYQQNPIAEEGNIIKESYFKVWNKKEDPMVDAVIVSMDTAFSTKQKADYSAYSVWGLFFKRETGHNGFAYTASNIILLGADKGRWAFNELIEKVEDIREIWNPDYYLIENKGSGQSLIQELRLKQFPVIEFNPGRDDKETRMHAAVPAFIAGRVWVPADEPWANDLVSEVCGFPALPHDDMCDTVSMVVNWMRKNTWLPSEGEIGFETDEDEQDKQRRHVGTYWTSVASKGEIKKRPTSLRK